FRTGGGIFYQDFERKGSMALLTLNPPFLTDVREGFAPNQPPAFLLQNGFPAGTVAPVDINNLDGVSILNIQGVDRNLRPGMIEQYSGGFEYSLRPDILLSATWVGNYGHRLWRGVNINQKVLTAPGQPSADIPFPAFRVDPTAPPIATLPTPIQQLESNGNSNYNAALISLERRFSRGPSFL